MDTTTDDRLSPQPSLRRTAGNADPVELAERLGGLVRPEQRFILGLAGPPGTGKSTFAAQLAAALYPLSCVVVPLDGFHLGTAIINGTPLQQRKGAIDTFDAAGYSVLIDRLRRRDEPVVYAPLYDRTIEEPIAGSIAIPRDTQVVITEGNYLLVPDGAWLRARRAMDQVWFVHTEQDIRLERLIGRHVQFGKTPEAAHAWVHASDEINATLVLATKSHADQVVAWN